MNLDEDEDSALESDVVGDKDGEEGEDEDEEGEDGEFFDVLDMLDGRGAEALQEAAKAEQMKDKPRRDEDISEESEEEEEDDEVEEEDQEEDVAMSADEGSVDEDAVDGLARFVTSLDAGKKRKADDVGSEDTSRRKRRILTERTQAGPENEFATRAGIT